MSARDRVPCQSQSESTRNNTLRRWHSALNQPTRILFRVLQWRASVRGVQGACNCCCCDIPWARASILMCLVFLVADTACGLCPSTALPQGLGPGASAPPRPSAAPQPADAAKASPQSSEKLEVHTDAVCTTASQLHHRRRRPSRKHALSEAMLIVHMSFRMLHRQKAERRISCLELLQQADTQSPRCILVPELDALLSCPGQYLSRSRYNLKKPMQVVEHH